MRVDLFTDDPEPNSRVSPCADALCDQLGIPRRGWVRGEIGVDRGVGTEGAPVIGFLFWVRADAVGDAATTALATALRAADGLNVGPRVFAVSVVPEESTVLSDEQFPRRID